MSSKSAAARGSLALITLICKFLVQHPSADKKMIQSNVAGLTARSVYDKLRYLERKGYVQKFGTCYKVSAQVKQLLAEDAVWKVQIPVPGAWDGRWHVVSFDIPKDKRKRRDIFRRRLRELGFVLFQDSVWILPFACEFEIRTIAKFYKIEKYISFIVAEKISNEDSLRRHFKV